MMRYHEIITEADQMGDLPTRHFDELFHVGTMNIKHKTFQSFEGAGLSVSLHPTIWRRIGKNWVNGNLWRLTRNGNRFLDHKAMPQAFRDRVIQWGVAHDFVRVTTTPPDNKYSPSGMVNVSATHKLLVRTRQMELPAGAEVLVLTLYIEDETDLDGIWWDDPIDAKVGGSAPRGVILRARLPQWTIEQVSEDMAPDKDTFKRKRVKKP